MRFVAAAYVLVFHYAAFYFDPASIPQAIGLGYSGVTFFFVLSGFILAYTYRQADLSTRETVARFRWARVARVYPVYLLSLLIALPWLAAWVVKTPPPLQGLMAASAVLAPLGLHAWVPGAACALDCPSWSISTEAFFYLAFPALLPVVLRAPGRAAAATLVLWLAATALAILAWNRWAPGVSLIAPEGAGLGAQLLAQGIKYNPLLRLPEFVAGLLLYVVWTRVRLPVAGLLGTAALAALALVSAAPHLPVAPMHNGLTVLVWAPLILAGAAIRSGPLVAPAALFLGKISFALYLLHTPAHALLVTLDKVALGGRLGAAPWLAASCATALALAAAAAMHLLVEEPARRRILARVSGERAGAPLPSA
nr:acyltransferase [Methylobacterium sp. BTF04]